MFLLRLICLFFVLSAPSASADSAGIFSSIKQMAGISDAKFLRPEQAFKLNVKASDGRTLAAEFEPAEGYYLYKERLEFSLQDAPGIQISKVNLPPGEIKEDPNLGKTEVYHKPFTAIIDLAREKSPDGKLALLATYQGCSEKGLCYSPVTARFDLRLPADSGPAKSSGDDSSRISALFKAGSFWMIILSFAGFGALLSLTPCMFPMIPILSGIIVGHGEHLTRRRGFILSSVYVLGMAMVYSAAGVFAGFSGELVSSALQNPWILGAFSLIFVFLAFSMFGFYDLQMPTFLQSKLSDASNRLKGGHLSGVFLMGAISAVIVGPCCAAPLAGALIYIGKTHDIWLGGAALFSMGIGMGLPLILVGLSAGSLMPKAGPWMQSVKNFFGFVLLGLAIWMVTPVISAVAVMLLWAALLIISAMYLHAIDPLPHGASGFQKLWKGVGLIALLLGAALLVGALSGGRDVLQPLAGFKSANASVNQIRFEKVRNVAELDARLKAAKGKNVMLDFYADWCVSCKEMERFTFVDPKVQAKLSEAVLLQADVTANSPEDAALLRRFNLFGPPGIIFFDREGSEMAQRVVGEQDAVTFLATLNSLFI